MKRFDARPTLDSDTEWAQWVLRVTQQPCADDPHHDGWIAAASSLIAAEMQRQRRGSARSAKRDAIPRATPTEDRG